MKHLYYMYYSSQYLDQDYRRWVKLTLTLLAIQLLTITLSAITQPLKYLLLTIQATGGGVNTLYQIFNIFIWNFNFLLAMHIPIIGAAFNIYQCIIVGTHLSLTPKISLTSLFTYPHLYIEELAYAMASANGINLILQQREGCPIELSITTFLERFLYSVAVLFLAAVTETLILIGI